MLNGGGTPNIRLGPMERSERHGKGTRDLSKSVMLSEARDLRVE
jgi:hypothetical protein